ncbi:MAG: class I adenylate-forming enzyme family protein, partial [Candidatus Omnitrophota bacterium]
MNLVRFLEKAASDSLDHPAIIEENTKITYRQFWHRVDILAKSFRDIGIKEGDRIAIALPNCPEYIYAFFAALKINAIAVPLKQAMTAYELKTILKDCRPALFITDNKFLRRRLPFDPDVGVGKIIICSKRINRQASFKTAIKIEDLFKTTSRLGTTFPSDDNTVASINYTYRGYGYPLGAMLTHGNYRYGIATYIGTTGISSGMNVLLGLPIFHIYPLIGCIMAPIFKCCPIVIIKQINFKDIIKIIDSFKINVLTLIPTFYLGLLKTYKKDYNKLGSVQ